MEHRADPLQRYVERSAALDARWRAIQQLEGEAYMNAVRDFAVEKARLRRAWAAFRPSAQFPPDVTPMEVVEQ
jgi:hypothetical protein